MLVDQIHQGGYQNRVLEDSIYEEKQKRIAAEKDRDHWKTARQDAIAAGELMQAEIETLRGAMAADDKRLRDAEQRVWPEETWGCDAPDKMADEILSLRQQLDAARADNVEVRRRLNEETDRHRKTNAEKIELFEQKEWANKHAAELVRERDEARAECETLRKQLANAERSASDEFTERQVLTVEAEQDAAAWQQQLGSANAEISYLRARLDEARSVNVDLQQQLDVARGETAEARRRNAELVRERDAAHQTILMQRQGIERLRAFAETVRECLSRENSHISNADINAVRNALNTLDLKPTSATETEGGQ